MFLLAAFQESRSHCFAAQNYGQDRSCHSRKRRHQKGENKCTQRSAKAVKNVPSLGCRSSKVEDTRHYFPFLKHVYLLFAKRQLCWNLMYTKLFKPFSPFQYAFFFVVFIRNLNQNLCHSQQSLSKMEPFHLQPIKHFKLFAIICHRLILVYYNYYFFVSQ